MKKHLFVSFILCFVLFFSLPVFAAPGDFHGGSGTAADPYLIADAAELDRVRDYPDAHFKQVANIIFTEEDFSPGGAFYNGGQGWEPIGSGLSDAFRGSFFGNGYFISGLRLTAEAKNGINAGLFGYNLGELRGVRLVSGSVRVDTSSFYTYVGGICGRNDGGTLIDCVNMAEISVTLAEGADPHYVYCGGITAYQSGGRVERCGNKGRIFADGGGHGYVGGVCGYNDEGAVSQCFNHGACDVFTSVFGYVGGICGYNTENARVADTYNAGMLFHEAEEISFGYTGGICGGNYGEIAKSYHISSLGGEYVGGICGCNGDDALILDCFYSDEISLGAGYGKDGGMALSLEKMTSAGAFHGFDFETVWGVDPSAGYRYPQLRWEIERKILFFDDVILGRHWFAEYVYDAVSQGILNGKGVHADGIPYYNPEGLITRGEFAKILAAASGEDLSEYEDLGIFPDAKDHWASTYINWAAEKGIVTGFPDGSFRPQDSITREQMAVMICRYAAYKGIDLSKTVTKADFADDAQITWSAEAVYAMQQAGIINGYHENGAFWFKPAGNATRAEAAAMISRFLDL